MDPQPVVSRSSKHHGIALWPAPSENPRDPLRWPRWLKLLAIVSTAMCNFTANFAGAGPSVATQLFQHQFHESANTVNGLLTFNFLLLGLGNLFWVPFAVKYGKRASLITSMGLLFAVLCWTARAETFSSLLAARCVSGFAAAAGESIVPGIVSDIFFLHERAAMMSIFIILVSSATALGPLIAGYMVQYSKGTWRDFVWLSAALAALNFILLILFYPESNFHRQDNPSGPAVEDVEALAEDTDKKGSSTTHERHTSHGVQDVDQVQVSWKSIWFSFVTVDKKVNLFRTFLRPAVFLAFPNVLWAVFVYGVALSAQVILIFAFPSLLLAPPYLFTPGDVGLMQIAAIVGFVFATFGGGWLADIITARQIIKHGGHFSPEYRLCALLPGFWVGPVGCIIIAFSCAYKLHWSAIAVGFGCASFGTVYGPNIAITYVVESYPDCATESVVIINAAKNLLAFVFLYVAVEWVHSSGWIQVYMIMFMLSTLAMLMAIPLYMYGGQLRRWSRSIRILK